jgi:hypothetical protein
MVRKPSPLPLSLLLISFPTLPPSQHPRLIPQIYTPHLSFPLSKRGTKEDFCTAPLKHLSSSPYKEGDTGGEVIKEYLKGRVYTSNLLSYTENIILLALPNTTKVERASGFWLWVGCNGFQ